MSVPYGTSLRGETHIVDRSTRARRLADRDFGFHESPMRAARSTLSLRTAFPWMRPNVAAQLGAFGVDLRDPGVSEIAGVELARRSREGFAATGQRRNTREVRNVQARPVWQERLSLDPATRDRNMAQIVGMDPAEFAALPDVEVYRAAYLSGRSVEDQRSMLSTPAMQASLGVQSPEDEAMEPVSAEDIGLPTGATPREYLAEIGRGRYRPEVQAQRTSTEGLAALLPAVDAQFRANANTFAMARTIADRGPDQPGSLGPAGALVLRQPSTDPRAAQELAAQLPGIDTTFRHIRRGGLTYQGIPLPGGDVSADELMPAWERDRSEIHRTLTDKRDELDATYDGRDMPRSVQATYDGIVAAVEALEPELQSLGPDLGSFNVGDLSDAVWGGTKTTVRTATMAMDALWQGGQARFRQIVNEPSDAGNWLALNPYATLATAVPAALSGGDVDPLHLGEQFGQTDLGVSLDRIANGEGWADTLLRGGGEGFYVTPDSEVGAERRAREREYGLIGGHVITMGRQAADWAQLEPDTLPFDVVSGAVDLAWLLVEPGGALVDAATRGPAFRQALANAGGFTATRSLHPDQFARWLGDSDGQAVLRHFADIDPTDDLAIYRSRQMMANGPAGSAMPGWAHDTLARGEVGDTEYVEELLRNFTGMGYATPGVARRETLAPGVAWRRRMSQSRLAQQVPDTGARALDITDADGFARGLEESLRNARVDDAEVARIIGRVYSEGYEIPTRVRVQQIERELGDLETRGVNPAALDDSDDALRYQSLADTRDELMSGLFINRPTPHRNVLFDVWGEAQAAKRARLVDAGVDEGKARRMTFLADGYSSGDELDRLGSMREVVDEILATVDRRMLDDTTSDSLYWLNLTTDGEKVGSANRRLWLNVDGTPTTDLSSPGFAHVAAEHLNRYLPLEDDYRQLARLTREPGVAQWLGRAIAGGEGQLRSGAAAAEWAMNKVWKPSRLLRPAWPLRVVGEEQFRIAATGFDSAVSHPLSFVSMVMGTPHDGRLHRMLGGETHGRLATDVEGEPWDVLDEFTEAMNRGRSTWLIEGAGSGGRFQPAAYYALTDDAGQWSAGYAEAYVDHLARLHSSDEVRQIAQILRGEHSQYDDVAGLTDAAGGAFDNVDDLRSSPAGQTQIGQLRARMADSHTELLSRGEPTYKARYDAGDADEAIRSWDDFIESIQVRIAELTGGDDELLGAIARGRFSDGLALNKPGTSRINKRAADRVRDRHAASVPRVVSGDESFGAGAIGRVGQGYDRALERLYSLLGAIPTDRLSRSPAFRQFYLRRLQELMPFLTGDAQAQALRNAEELMKVQSRGWHVRMSAYLDDGVISPTLASLRRASLTGKGDLGLELADDLAKHAALDQTRWLLYDVHKRGQFMDALRMVFPFGEAWKEVATRWLQLTAQRPGTVTQRATQVAQIAGGPQDWADIVDDPSQHGHVFTNSTGETVFAYPGSEWFTGALTGTPVTLTGSLNGLTMMNSVVPGVGPMIQLPLSAVPAFRDSPEFEGIRDVLFPYGMGDDPTESWSSAAMAGADAIVSPAVQRAVIGLVTATTGSGPADDRLFLNSVFDVMRHHVSAGTHTTDSQPNINRLIRDSTRDAGLLYLIRGIAGMTLPSAPIPEFSVEGNDGSLLMLRALSDQYRAMQDEDYTTATRRFLDRYGERMSLVIQAKTVPRAAMLPVTAEADRWVQANAGVEKDYPLTFGLWAPGNTRDQDFDFDAYNRYVNDRAVKTLGRELVLEDLVGLANDRVASDIYYTQRDEMIAENDGGDLTAEQERWLSAELRPVLEDRYPGFGDDGLPEGPTSDRLRQLLGRPGQTNTEVRRMLDDDRIDEPLRRAVGLYLAEHDAILTDLSEHPDAWGGATTYYESSGTRPLRDWIRDELVPGIRAELPERYRTRWDVVYERLFERTMLPVYAEEQEVAA